MIDGFIVTSATEEEPTGPKIQLAMWVCISFLVDLLQTNLFLPNFRFFFAFCFAILLLSHPLEIGMLLCMSFFFPTYN